MTTRQPSAQAVPSNCEPGTIDAIPLQVLPRTYVRDDEA